MTTDPTGIAGNDSPTYLTTTIPYVNARPHLGFALELVQADVLARHARLAGRGPVRLQTGTDENSLKNVLAAEAAGVPVRDFVDRNARAFLDLHGPLSVSADDVVRTSEPRHRAGVERLWRACAHDLYRRRYEGLYCVGCEAFHAKGGRCAEHGTELERVSEENWFFRLSRHTGRLHDLIASGALRIEPAERRREVLGLVAGGLEDFSVSRPAARARGWGIPVPGDPGQVVYVWWDALANYLTALGDDRGRWWTDAGRRVHVVGKDVLRFHAVHWPAILLSAGEAPPTDVLVHDHLTVDGRKISKSGGPAVDPVELVRAYGTDAVRWWLLRDVARVGETDFTAGRLAARADRELAHGIGNLVKRVVTLVHRHRDGRVPADGDAAPFFAGVDESVAAALHDADFRAATGALWNVVVEANRHIERVRPWDLAGRRGAGRDLDEALATLIGVCRGLAVRLEPFLPDGAARARAALDDRGGGALPPPESLFGRHL
ncbi:MULTISPECIES: methionine--tRNA ligase [Actinomadura]|uniref:methionine--tRNA ligase n=1 Tax=Actinomadura yumaensis TaxID=111807 RepID=A0ABW2CY23_9ACTN|nr:methionine--tRNA ligase [Actinomadura sp. J1-007]MWK39251.1 class I tRNA ligase family protein [Actinomadura sp. J1-007]